MKAILRRQEGNDVQTTGTLEVFDYDGKRVYKCFTLELPDKNNERRVSRIPEGNYIVKSRWSSKYDWHFHVQDVPNRSYILIHKGNYNKHTLGCILVGKSLHDINGDGNSDVTSSGDTMTKLNEVLPKEFELDITDEQ